MLFKPHSPGHAPKSAPATIRSNRSGNRPIGRAALATLAQGTSFGTAANVWNFYA
jgi:hypothetical protein